jgi:hypothetical protein
MLPPLVTTPKNKEELLQIVTRYGLIKLAELLKYEPFETLKCYSNSAWAELCSQYPEEHFPDRPVKCC